MLDAGEPSVLAHRCDTDGTVVAVHDLAGTEVTARLTLDGLDDSAVLDDLLTDGHTAMPGDGRVALTLGPYGSRWLRARVE